MTEFEDEIRRFVRRRVKDRGEQEDIRQEIWFAVRAALPRFEGKASPRTWLLRITRNKIIDHHRTAGRQPYMDAVSSSQIAASVVRDRTGLSSRLRRQERAEIVQRALAELNPTEQDLLMMRFADDLWPREIAEVLGVPEGTVKTRIRRGKALLGELLTELADSQEKLRSTVTRLDEWAEQLRSGLLARDHSE